MTSDPAEHPALTFLRALDPSPDARWYIRSYIEDKTAKGAVAPPCAYSPEDAVAELTRYNRPEEEEGWGAYVVVNDGGQKKDEIRRVRALFIDLDGGPLEPVLEWCERTRLMPTIVTETSPGRYHVFWRVYDCGTSSFRGLQKRLIKQFGSDPVIHDLSRVMRVPGFMHRKRAPYMSEILYVDPTAEYPAARFSDTLAEGGSAPERVSGTQLSQMGDGSGRNSYLTSLAGSLRARGQSSDEIRAALIGASGQMRDPLPEEEIDRILTSAGSWAPGVSLTRGSHQVMAERAIALLEEIWPVRAHQDYLVTYRGGVWTREDTRHIRAWLASTFDGAQYPTADGKTARVNMSHEKAESIRRSMLDIAPQLCPEDGGVEGVGFVNGFLPLGGKVLLPHAMEHKCVFGVRYPYLPGAAPRFEAWLASTFPSEKEGVAKVKILQEFAGACLFGIAPNYQRAILMYSSGGSGKSVFLSMLETLLSGHISHTMPSKLAAYEGADMATSRANLCGEMDEKELLGGTGLLKKLIAGDVVTVRQIRETPISFKPKLGLIAACNSLPTVTDTSLGFWSRWIVIEFTEKFRGEDGEVTMDVWRNVFKEEIGGIAAWAVEGAERLIQQRGYTTMSQMDQARKQAWVDSDPVHMFMKEQGPGRWPTKEIYRDYSTFARQNGFGPMNVVTFGKRVRTVPGVSEYRTNQHKGVVYEP